MILLTSVSPPVVNEASGSHPSSFGSTCDGHAAARIHVLPWDARRMPPLTVACPSRSAPLKTRNLNELPPPSGRSGEATSQRRPPAPFDQLCRSAHPMRRRRRAPALRTSSSSDAVPQRAGLCRRLQDAVRPSSATVRPWVETANPVERGLEPNETRRQRPKYQEERSDA